MSKIHRKNPEVLKPIIFNLIEYNGFFNLIESLPFQTPTLE
jgi:hypothetical protein